MKRAAFIQSNGKIHPVYGGGRADKVAAEFELFSDVLTQSIIKERAGELKDIQYLFSTWGIDAAPCGFCSSSAFPDLVFWTSREYFPDSGRCTYLTGQRMKKADTSVTHWVKPWMNGEAISRWSPKPGAIFLH